MKVNITKAVAIFLLMIFNVNLTAQQQGVGVIPDKKYLWFKGPTPFEDKQRVEPVVQVPPICGKKRRANGLDLPLPFGVGINTLYYVQNYEASELRITSEETPITAEPLSMYQNTRSSEIKVTFRPDVWVLPILNVYGIIGYTEGTTSPNLSVTSILVKNVPILGEIILNDTFAINDRLIYHGPTYGGGATLSGGVGSFFLLIDYHYTVTDPSDLDGKLYNHFFSPKLGILLGGKSKRSTGTFWLGTMYISDKHTFKGELDTKDIAPELEILFGEKANYSGKVTSIQPWNLIVGGSWVYNSRHNFIAEAGFFERKQVSFTYAFRF